MFKNYFKVAYRNLTRKRFFSLVNVAGLAIGMTACFFIFQYIYFESGYDRFHENADRLFRLGIRYLAEDNGSASNHPASGPAMKSEFAEVQDAARLFPLSVYINSGLTKGVDPKTNTVVSYTDGRGKSNVFNEEKIYIADGSFFNLFTFPFTRGNSLVSLSSPNSAVISVSMARKLFGKEDPLGKTIQINGQWPMKVTGVFKDVPANSHIHFNMLISSSSIDEKYLQNNWTWPESYNYILMKPGSDIKKVEAQLPAFVERHMGNLMKHFNFRCELFLTPVVDIHLKSKYFYEPQPQGNEKAVKLLSLIGGFILFIAWINYINLSTARALERAKEVALRKVVGASRPQLMVQFIIESLLINIFALLISVIIIVPSFSFVNGLFTGNPTEGMLASPLWQTTIFWKSFIAVFIAGVLLTGAYPAFVLSGFQPALAIKGKFTQSFQSISVRKVLVTFQFVLSILLIAGTITVFRQLSFMQNTQPGYNRNQVVVIKSPSVIEKPEAGKINVFKSLALQNSSIRSITLSSDVPGKALTSFNSIWLGTKEETSSISTFMMEVDEDFIPTYQIALGAGRNFTSRDSVAISQTDHAKLMINETLARKLGYKNNDDAIYQKILFRPDGRIAQGEIIAVVKDYHQRSLKEQYDPIAYYYPDWNQWKYISIVSNGNEAEYSLASLGGLYKNLFPGNNFDYFFLDDYFHEQYKADQQFGSVFTLFTLVAIFVACLGLLGLSSLMINLRTREIGIRKVLGASVSGLLILFSKDFIIMILWASVIAIPIIYFGANEWLSNYAFRVNVNWIIFVVPSLMLVIISLATVGIQSRKAALMNPSKTLKTE